MKLKIARETVRELSLEEIGRVGVFGAGTQQSICIGCGPSELNQCITHGDCLSTTGTLFSCLG